MSISENLKTVQDKIQSIIRKNNLKQDVKLIAVSKTFPSSCVVEAFNAGHLVFGENKVQEGEIKKKELAQYPIQWHLIGHLQTNKAKKAAEIFDYIHSIDSFKLAEKVSKACQELNKQMPILIQVNTSDEDSKSGLPSEFSIIREEIEKIQKLPNLAIKGLMTIGPLTENSIAVRKSFILLRTLRNQLQEVFPNLDLSELSMGMSGDYEIAIEEGATFIRVGSALFGQRTYPH